MIEPLTQIGGFFIRQADGNWTLVAISGFYELDDNTSQSDVQWNNLHLGTGEAKDKGVDQNE